MRKYLEISQIIGYDKVAFFSLYLVYISNVNSNLLSIDLFPSLSSELQNLNTTGLIWTCGPVFPGIFLFTSLTIWNLLKNLNLNNIYCGICCSKIRWEFFRHQNDNSFIFGKMLCYLKNQHKKSQHESVLNIVLLKGNSFKYYFPGVKNKAAFFCC